MSALAEAVVVPVAAVAAQAARRARMPQLEVSGSTTHLFYVARSAVTGAGAGASRAGRGGGRGGGRSVQHRGRAPTSRSELCGRAA